ncbi:MAG: hypothetical protein MR528_09975 [Lachnospiraceae bacterium]|nr:hypothetical protein [Lachnospiraceae bacterium]
MVTKDSVKGSPANVDVRFKSERYQSFFVFPAFVSVSARIKSTARPAAVDQTEIQRLFFIAVR